MFESHIQTVYPRLGLQFLREQRRRFPAPPVPLLDIPVPNPVEPQPVLAELEAFAPGFRRWAEGFGP